MDEIESNTANEDGIISSEALVNNSSPNGQKSELFTLAASQASTAIVVVVTMVVLSYQAYLGARTDIDKSFAIQSGFVLIMTTIYYLISAWNVEQFNFADIRILTPRCAMIEWIIRVVIFCFIGVSSFFLSGMIKISGMTSLGAGLVFLSGCAILFLFWDFIVTIGGGLSLAIKFIFLDIFCAITTISCLGSYLLSDQVFIKTISFISALIYAVSIPLIFHKQLLALLCSVLNRESRR